MGSGTVGTSSSAKVSVTTSPINVTSINTSSNTVSHQSHDRRVSSSSTSSNKSITVITNGEATMCIPTNGGTSGTVSPTSNVKSSNNNQSNSNSLPAQPTMAGSQEIPKIVEELLDS